MPFYGLLFVWVCFAWVGFSGLGRICVFVEWWRDRRKYHGLTSCVLSGGEADEDGW